MASFCITGELKGMTREQAKRKLESLGHTFHGFPKSTTNYIVCGVESKLVRGQVSAKLDAARKYGVTEITDSKFQSMLAGSQETQKQESTGELLLDTFLSTSDIGPRIEAYISEYGWGELNIKDLRERIDKALKARMMPDGKFYKLPHYDDYLKKIKDLDDGTNRVHVFIYLIRDSK